MSKFIIAALIALSLLALAAPASAGWYDAWGYYHYTCYWDPYGVPLGCY